MNSTHFWCRRALALTLLFSALALLVSCSMRPATNSLPRTTTIRFRARGERFEQKIGERWAPFVVCGVNIGASTPGQWSTEFVKTQQVFREWFKQIAAMNANAVRVYTLMAPAFYEALKHHNESNPGSPVFLIQEIWPEEDVPGHDLSETGYQASFMKEIAITIEALSGKGDIPGRKGRAYGMFTADVSPYVMAILVGRELEPDEILVTDRRARRSSYSGQYFQVLSGSSSECWLAEMCDTTVAEMRKHYWECPVGFVSWPPIDPMEHDTEWDPRGKMFVHNDKASVDARNIRTTELYFAGTFAAFHIYPNYPDFINNEPSYSSYGDAEGGLRYIGYLKHLKTHLPPVPCLVAEFGISTSIGIAHISPDGMHHGGLSEIQQGEMLGRLFRSIISEGYAGGLVFQWNDEWAKKTWTTEPLMIPYERHVLWHNLMDPEQNYGILAWEPEPSPKVSYGPAQSPDPRGPGPAIRSLQIWHDAQCIYLHAEFDHEAQPGSFGILIGVDTKDASRGIRHLPGIEAQLPLGSELVLSLEPEKAPELLVASAYNYWAGRFMPAVDDTPARLMLLTNREQVSKQGVRYPARYADHSRVEIGEIDFRSSRYNSLAILDIRPGGFALRFPWAILGFSDPSSKQVLWDSRLGLSLGSRDLVTVQKTEGVTFSLNTLYRDSSGKSRLSNAFPPASYSWPVWENVTVKARLKQSYSQLAEEFARYK